MPRYSPSDLYVVYCGPIPYGDSRPSADDLYTDRGEADAAAAEATAAARAAFPHVSFTYLVTTLEDYFSELYSAGRSDGQADERASFE